MIAAIIHLIIMIPFLIMAIVFSMGKGSFLIAGYNTMPESEKAQYDVVGLCKFMGKFMYGICFCLVLWALSQMLEMPALFIIGLILFIGLIIFLLVYLNTGNRFKHKGDNE